MRTRPTATIFVKSRPLRGSAFDQEPRGQAHGYDRRVTASRYDDHAAWYVDYTSRWELSSTASLPSDLNGLRMLDLGVGGAS